MPEKQNLFIIDLEYRTSREDALPFMEDHLAFVQKYFDAGTFLASGPKVPLIGGVIIAKAESREALEAIVREDAFHINECCHYSITEVSPSRSVEGLL
ncbi:YciI family protein [Kordiimonas lacus]|uniref:Uncharacterized conserved protein YciI, contains a putative active-site phosphohistidine n=1 Tax=Kordiimonas lacus TaxID=637679 RepID=A0A1G7AX76_9PROT|nr:YciI family protein [Kordiimonas lacus]SDE18556.1 Uncharacterized conserved protein YciI, contains a putative active-site phosphohistidine [Kordiimonas lacus]